MGQWQYWQLIALDGRAYCDGGELGQYFTSTRPEDVVYKWARWDARKDTRAGKAVQSSRIMEGYMITRTGNSILALPPEILLQIFGLLNVETSLRLSLTCMTMWQIGWDHLRQQITRYIPSGSWIGSRMILLGDCCKVDKRINEILNEKERNQIHAHDIENNIDTDLSDYAAANFREFYPAGPKELSFQYFPPWHKLQSELPLAQRKAVEHFLIYPWSIATSETWTMRNLTTKEYVHGPDLYGAFQEGDCPFGPHIGYPGFGYAILNRICWSQETDSALREDMTYGSWAGHRFEICPQSMHDEASDASWRDVSAEIVRELHSIMIECEANWGKRVGTRPGIFDGTVCRFGRPMPNY